MDRKRTSEITAARAQQTTGFMSASSAQKPFPPLSSAAKIRAEGTRIPTGPSTVGLILGSTDPAFQLADHGFKFFDPPITLRECSGDITGLEALRNMLRAV